MTSQDHVSPHTVTVALAEIKSGDPRAWERLVELVYPQLLKLAHGAMERERDGHVLQTTALVHEAWVKLVQDPRERIESRVHFFAAAARAMRRVLVDEARRRNALKRGGGAARVSISATLEADLAQPVATVAVDDVELLHAALAALEAHAGQRDKARIVEMRFFAGLTNEQVADVMGVSLATVKRDLEFARAWLRREMERLTA